jgi:hypothetical protein
MLARSVIFQESLEQADNFLGALDMCVVTGRCDLGSVSGVQS